MEINTHKRARMRQISGAAVVGTVLAVTIVATGAQTPTPAPATQVSDAVTKSQAFRFEMALRIAVEEGGRRLARQALVLTPELRLEAAEPAVVRSFSLPGYGYFFDVQAPSITSEVMVWDMRRRLAPPGGVPEMASPVSNGRVGAATAPVNPDPMAGEAPATFDANRAYTTYVREALIDALLDSSAVFTDLGPTDRLTIAASGIEAHTTNPLYRGSEDKMMLTISGADLIALRQNRLTRDDARLRIVVSRSF